jgi:ADP-ribosylglycohydrolase
VSLAWPRTANEAELDRAAGCLLGQVIGDSLGALVAHFGEVEHSDRFGVNTRIGVG